MNNYRQYVQTTCVIESHSMSLHHRSAEDALKELNITLPKPWTPPSIMNFVPAVRTGNLLFISGHGPTLADGSLLTGRVVSSTESSTSSTKDGEISVQAGYEAARITGLNILATIEATVGSLNRVKRVVKLLGFVACNFDFGETPLVINGCSDLFVSGLFVIIDAVWCSLRLC